MIRAPPGYPAFAGQQAGPSRWWHENDTAETAVSKSRSTSSDTDEDMSDGDSKLSELSSFDQMPSECYLAARTLLRITNPDVYDDATISDGLSTPSSMPSIEVTSPEGHAVGLEQGMAANHLPNADIDDGGTFAIYKSEQTVKAFRTALGMINKVSGTNYSRGDFPNLKLKYERKPRS